MAGTLVIDTLKSSTTGAPTFQNTSGTEVGQLCKAWVNFNGVTTATIRASFNVSSITRNAAGDYTVNFTNALPDANYTAIASGNGTTITDYNNTINIPFNDAPTTSSVRLKAVDSGSTIIARDMLYVSVAIFR